MGGTEKKILQEARKSDVVRARSGQGELFKRMVEEKGWLERISYGMFEITEEGEKALEKRLEEEESEKQQGLGDFS